MAQDDGAARAAIEATNNRFVAAFNAGDPARAAREAYTADARLLPPASPIVRGIEAISQFWVAAAAAMDAASVQLSSVELSVHGEMAHEIGEASVVNRSGEQLRVKYVVVWKQEQGDWRWDVDIWNLGV